MRALPIGPPAVMAVVAVALVAYGRVRTPGLAALDHLLPTRVAMVLLAAGAGFSLDDPSEPTVAGSPIVLRQRRTVRLVLTVVLWASGWLAVALTVATAGGPFPSGALTVEAAAWLCICLAVASSWGGAATGVSLLVAAVVLARLPGRWDVFPFPSAPSWGDAHRRWGAMVVAGAIALMLSSRDPARRRWSSRWRRRPGAAGARW